MLFSRERVEGVLVLRNRLLIRLDHICYALADSVSQNQLRSQTMYFIKFAPKPRQLSHDLYETTLRLSILEVNALFLCVLLFDLLAKLDVIFE